MNYAFPGQKLQDWLTQQWVIFRGKKIDPNENEWLVGPFGNVGVIGEEYISQLAEKENLIVVRNAKAGLIPDMGHLLASGNQRETLSGDIINFYDNTSNYVLNLSLQWNSFFRFMGVLIARLFSNRINQLNIPIRNFRDDEELNSEIINLVDPESRKTVYTFWFRSVKSTGQVIYSGIYDVCKLPSGEKCIKAVFPLPNGNATVFMKPRVGPNSELILESAGKKFGDAGFYFSLKDSKGNYWSRFIKSFRDRIVIKSENGQITAEQTLTLWNCRVLQFNYKIEIAE